jgi:hypothetical protein
MFSYIVSRRAGKMNDQRKNAFGYQIECAPSGATFYIHGTRCTRSDILRLAMVAERLPATIRTLRTDLHAVATIDFDTLIALRAMLVQWRTDRNGAVRFLMRQATVRESTNTLRSRHVNVARSSRSVTTLRIRNAIG